MDSRRLIEQADSALYQAKHQGRNLVIVHPN
jgi:PleD family two-component response regulator